MTPVVKDNIKRLDIKKNRFTIRFTTSTLLNPRSPVVSSTHMSLETNVVIVGSKTPLIFGSSV